jgi:hypothetical protein
MELPYGSRQPCAFLMNFRLEFRSANAKMFRDLPRFFVLNNFPARQTSLFDPGLLLMNCPIQADAAFF